MKPPRMSAAKLDVRVIGYFSAVMFFILTGVVFVGAHFTAGLMADSLFGSMRQATTQVRNWYDDGIAMAAHIYATDQLLDSGQPDKLFYTSQEGTKGVLPLRVYTQLGPLSRRSDFINSVYVYSFVNDALISSNEGVFFHFTAEDNPYRRYYDLARFSVACDPDAPAWGAYDVFAKDQRVPSYRQVLLTQGKPSGVVVVNCNETVFQQSVAPTLLHVRGSLLIFDEDLRVLYSDIPGVVGQTLSLPDLSSGRVSNVVLDGAPHMLTFVRSERGGWYYAVAASSRAFLQPIQSFSLAVSAGAAVLMLLTLLAFAFVGTRVFAPFNKLVARLRSERVGAGPGGDVETIDRAFRNITGELLGARRMLSGDRQLREHKLLLSIITGQLHSEPEARARMEALCLKLPYPSFTLCIMRFPMRDMQTLGETYADGFLTVAVEAIRQGFSSLPCCIIGMPLSRNEAIVVINLEKADTLAEVLGQALASLHSRLGAQCNIALADPVRGVSQLSASYASAQDVIRLSFLYPGGNVFTPADLQNRRHMIIEQSELDDIASHLRAGRADEVRSCVGEYIARCRQEGATCESVSVSVSAVIGAVLRTSAAMDADLHRPGRGALSEGLMQADTVDEYLEWLGDILIMIDHAADDRTLHSAYMERVKAYIGEHIEGDVSQKCVAEEMKVSTGHLSRLFKECTGMNYQAYVVEQKLLHAMTLLRDTSGSVVSIAAKLGYFQPAYFAKLFREHTGCTPGQYRKMNATRRTPTQHI